MLRTAALRLASPRFRSERGQTLVIFVVMFSVLMGMSAFAIDQGVWLGHRRAAQKDADTAARGGAIVYLSDPTDLAEAENQAQLVAQQNDAKTDAPSSFVASDSCTDFRGDTIAGVPSIHVEINRPTASLFARLFGIDGLQDLGARATACAGQPEEVSGTDPFYTAFGVASPDPKCFDSNGNPRLGSICPIMVPSTYVDTGSRGLLSLQDDLSDATNCDPFSVNSCETRCTEPNSSNVDQAVVSSSVAICAVDDGVYTKQGALNNVKGAVRCRILGYDDVGNQCPNGKRSTQAAPGEGACDAAFNKSGAQIPPFASQLSPPFPPGDVIGSPAGVDDFEEVFSRPGGGPPLGLAGTEFLTANICDGRPSPRVFTIIIAEDPPGPGGTLRVKKHATFYVLGCWDLENPNSLNFAGSIDPFCDDITASVTSLVGIFVRAYIPSGGGALSPCDPQDPLEPCIGQTIVMVE